MGTRSRVALRASPTSIGALASDTRGTRPCRTSTQYTCPSSSWRSHSRTDFAMPSRRSPRLVSSSFSSSESPLRKLVRLAAELLQFLGEHVRHDTRFRTGHSSARARARSAERKARLSGFVPRSTFRVPRWGEEPLVDRQEELLGRLPGTWLRRSRRRRRGWRESLHRPTRSWFSTYSTPPWNGQPEVIRGHVFERVGLVEDDRLIIREQPATGPPQCQIGEEQGVIHHEDVRPEDCACGPGSRSIPCVSGTCGRGDSLSLCTRSHTGS